MEVNLRNITSPHLPGTAGEVKRSMPRTLASISPPIPIGEGGGEGGVVTNDWSLTAYLKFNHDKL